MTPHIQPQKSDFYFKIATYDDNKDDDDENADDANASAYIAYRHSKDRKSDSAQINAVFWDGHAETMKRGDVVATVSNTASNLGAAANRNAVWFLRWDLGKP
jgi:prepilin-type processing-associated H-X9-DG protein